MEQQNKILNTIQTLEEKILALQSGIKVTLPLLMRLFQENLVGFMMALAPDVTKRTIG